MITLITGIAGFSGKYLFTHLKEKQSGMRVVGLDINTPDFLGSNTVISCNLLDSNKLTRVIKEISPDYIFHLAGLNFAQHPSDFFSVNVIGTINLFESIVKNLNKFSPLLLIPGSAAEYGVVSESDLPIDENIPLRPLSLYAISKMAQDLIAYQYHVTFGVRVIRVRPFNIIGPGQPTALVCGKIVDEVCKVKAGLKSYVDLLGIKSERDFIDIRDVVHAYWCLMENGNTGDVYNIGSGKGTSIKDVLRIAAKHVDIKLEVKVSEPTRKKSNINKSVADISKIKSHAGWSPSINLAKSIQDMIDFRFQSYGKQGFRVE